jgi:hypothetical protein
MCPLHPSRPLLHDMLRKFPLVTLKFIAIVNRLYLFQGQATSSFQDWKGVFTEIIAYGRAVLRPHHRYYCYSCWPASTLRNCRQCQLCYCIVYYLTRCCPLSVQSRKIFLVPAIISLTTSLLCVLEQTSSVWHHQSLTAIFVSGIKPGSCHSWPSLNQNSLEKEQFIMIWSTVVSWSLSHKVHLAGAGRPLTVS